MATAVGQPGPLPDKFLATAERAVREGGSVIIPDPAFAALREVFRLGD